MSIEQIAALRQRTFQHLRPPPKLRLSEWLEKNVRLPQAVAAQSGALRLFPYQTEIADSIGDPAVERVTLLKAARVGASQLMVGAIGHFALNDPCPQMVVLPSEADGRLLMTGSIEPTFSASPALRSALTEDASGRDTMLSRHYPGGHLSIVSGGSPKNLRARTVRCLWLDEVDGLEVSVANEGDPVALAIRRTATYPDRKIVMMSTPVDEATSRILRAYEAGDQRVYETPCACGDWHEILWRDIRWPEGKPEEAFHVCPACGGITEEGGAKVEKITAGRWRATKPEVLNHRSYKLPAFISTLKNASWGQLAIEFVAAGKDPNLLKTWVNTVAGEAWRDDSEGIDDGDLYSRREPIGLDRIPENCLFLTGGADLQHDRIELTTLGWTAEGAAMALEHLVIWGDPHGADLWKDYDAALRRSWTHPLGGQIRYDAVLTDSGDGQTVDRVYEFCRGRSAQRIFPLKGVAGFTRPIVETGHARSKTVRLQLVGVDVVKLRLMNMIRAGQIAFSDTLTPDWFEQLGGERLQTRYSRGVPVREWHRLSGRRVEAWDCVCYGIAAKALIAGIDIPRRQAELSTAAALPKPVPTVIRSQWLGR